MLRCSDTQNEIIIDIKDVHFTYTTGQNNIPALSNCSWQVKKGEFVAVVGGNGSGKSTLAKHLNGLLIPQQGNVLVGGLDTRQPENLSTIRRLVGMVFQNPDNQFVAATVEEDVAFGPENLGVEPAKIKTRVSYFLELLQLTSSKASSPHQLSGGQKQRLAIASVMAMQPQVLVLDEPTAMLDPAGRRELLTTILKLNRDKKTTTILITHFMEEAVLADRVIVLHRGKVELDGTPGQVFNHQRELKKWGLKLPTVVEMALLLEQRGFKIDNLPLNTEQLVNMICGQLKV